MPQRKNRHRPVTPRAAKFSDESEDEYYERSTEERRQQVELMLDKLAVSQPERHFIVNTAEKVVDLICDDYILARKHQNLNPECISAAATVAMMIVRED